MVAAVNETANEAPNEARPEGAALFAPAVARRLVVKVGSSLLVEQDGTIRQAWLKALIEDLVRRHRAGQEIMVVSSGAIALGSRRLHLPQGGKRTLEDGQAAAAIGQILLSGLWAELFAAHGIAAAQMLLTPTDFENRRRYLNASATLDRLLHLGAIPVMNENDSVATEEIRFGDNDRLAARVAQAARADALILLSDIDGLYTANPALDPGAAFVPLVTDLDAVAHMASSASSSGMGKGGMITKIEAVKIAFAAGVPVAIVAGKPLHPLRRFAESGRGTIFVAPDAMRARKAWLAGRMLVAGRVLIDAGAVRALHSGKSLLPAGITAIEGAFRRGDAVDVTALDGALVARGIVSYDADDLQRIAGHKSREIADLLGYAPRSAAIHRDQLVLLDKG